MPGDTHERMDGLKRFMTVYFSAYLEILALVMGIVTASVFFWTGPVLIMMEWAESLLFSGMNALFLWLAFKTSRVKFWDVIRTLARRQLILLIFFTILAGGEVTPAGSILPGWTMLAYTVTRTVRKMDQRRAEKIASGELDV